MTEINTYSSAVDDVVARSGRPDRRTDIIAFVRTTIRECHVRSYFRNDLTEDSIAALQDGYVWEYPQEFRILRTVRYPLTNRRGEAIYPPEILPGKNQRDKTHFYYGGPGYYVFAGVEALDRIDVAYYSVSKKIPYYAKTERPAIFNLEDNVWTYLTATTPEEKIEARGKVSNWLLFDYYDLIVEGSMAKVLKVVGDPRAGAAYALYKSYQKDLIYTEPSDSLNK